MAAEQHALPQMGLVQPLPGGMLQAEQLQHQLQHMQHMLDALRMQAGGGAAAVCDGMVAAADASAAMTQQHLAHVMAAQQAWNHGQLF